MSAGQSKPVIAVVSAGEMGAAVAWRLHSHECRILTLLEGRSESTKKRAREAGMEESSLQSIMEEADWVLSIMPPGEAEGFIKSFLASYRNASSRRSPIFVDCNAKNPQTAMNYASMFMGTSIAFIDACIIGWPPKDDHDPSFYASVMPDNEAALDSFVGLSKFGMVVKPLKGEGTSIGDASAVKMTFSGIMKGMVGLYTTMILASHTHSPSVSDALLRELVRSRPTDVERIIRYVPNSYTKAFRFVSEMEEMAGFVRENVDLNALRPSNAEPNFAGGVEQIYHGFAAIFERVARSVDSGGNQQDLEILKDFVEGAKKQMDDFP